MPVNISCPTCGKKFKVRDEVIGKKLRCAGCKEPFLAEAPMELAPVETPPDFDSMAIPDEEPVAPQQQTSGRAASRQTSTPTPSAKVRQPIVETKRLKPGNSHGGAVAQRFGVSCTIIGAGGLILPHFGRQFTILSGLGSNAEAGAVVLLIIGIVLLIVGHAKNQ